MQLNVVVVKVNGVESVKIDLTQKVSLSLFILPSVIHLSFFTCSDESDRGPWVQCGCYCRC